MKWCQARLSPPLIGQIMAEASLDTPEEYMRDVYDEYVERRKFLIDGLNRIPGCYYPIPMLSLIHIFFTTVVSFLPNLFLNS